MKSIVLATCNRLPELQPGDDLLAAELAARGAQVSSAPWNGPFTPFETADLIVVRTTWDYDEQPAAFTEWLGRLAVVSGRVANAPTLMRWNLRKTYLIELAEKGASLAPTRLVSPEAASIAAGMAALGLDEAVVKPVFGAGARGLSIVRKSEPATIERAAQELRHEGLLQPLIPEIRTRGETSLVFIRGAFSHAVVKRAKPGSILVQSEYGGTVAPVAPPAWALEEARRTLSLLPEAPDYARIDVVILDERLLLMEVELIEPELFLQHEEAAPRRFADALMKKLED
ncbi:MAG: hypothetical protein R3C55_14650 [Parvularculaceae bacterium]